MRGLILSLTIAAMSFPATANAQLFSRIRGCQPKASQTQDQVQQLQRLAQAAQLAQLAQAAERQKVYNRMRVLLQVQRNTEAIERANTLIRDNRSQQLRDHLESKIRLHIHQEAITRLYERCKTPEITQLPAAVPDPLQQLPTLQAIPTLPAYRP